MMPYLLEDANLTLYTGDALAVLRVLPDESAQMCVTSPPYWGLRDYDVEGQLGVESTPAEYVATMVDIFREVRRVLRKDGVLFLNLGDSYCSQPNQRVQKPDGRQDVAGWKQATNTGSLTQGSSYVPGLKPKDLIMVPARVALALQADGWYLRSEIIWAKPNPMPESVTDRPTKAHEQVYLLTKTPRYYFDADAISEPAKWHGPNGRPKAGPHAGQMHERAGSNRKQQRRAVELAEQGGLTDAHIEAIRAVGITDVGKAQHTQNGFGKNDPEIQRLADEAKTVLGGYYREFLMALDRNPRSVWEIQTQQYAKAHFAVFPERLAERCILAGSKKGDVVLDPFLGSGTTAVVARRHNRATIGIELNPDYCELAIERARTWYKRPRVVRLDPQSPQLSLEAEAVA